MEETGSNPALRGGIRRSRHLYARAVDGRAQRMAEGIAKAVAFAESSPDPAPETLLEDVYAMPLGRCGA